VTPEEIAAYRARPVNNVADTARFLSMGINQCRQAINRGDIKALRMGRKIIIPTAYVLSLIEP
jgi:hypothetical protein